jgi:hypothetical protein
MYCLRSAVTLVLVADISSAHSVADRQHAVSEVSRVHLPQVLQRIGQGMCMVLPHRAAQPCLISAHVDAYMHCVGDGAPPAGD